MAGSFLDAWDSTTNSSLTSITLAGYSISSGSNRFLFVFVAAEHNSTNCLPTGCTYGDQTMSEMVTPFRTPLSGWSLGIGGYYLLEAGIAAATGSDVVASFGGAPAAAAIAARSAQDVAQDTPTVATADTDASTPNPIILDLTEISDGVVLAGAGCGNSDACSWGAAMTEGTDDVEGTFTMSCADRLSTTSSNVDIEPTWGNQNRSVGISIAVGPYGAPAGSEGPLVGGRMLRGGTLLNRGVLLGRNWARCFAAAQQELRAAA